MRPHSLENIQGKNFYNSTPLKRPFVRIQNIFNSLRDDPHNMSEIIGKLLVETH
jgi:hypothetical protein